MKQLPKDRLITTRVTDEQLIQMDESIQSKDYPNRTAVIREAVAELIVNDKGELRSSLRREPSLFRGHVAEIRKELGLERRFS